MEPLFSDDREYESFKKRHAGHSARRFDIKDAEGELFLGLDIGSTTLKAVLCDKEGRICFSHYAKNDGSPLLLAIEILKDIYLYPLNLRFKLSISLIM